MTHVGVAAAAAGDDPARASAGAGELTSTSTRTRTDAGASRGGTDAGPDARSGAADPGRIDPLARPRLSPSVRARVDRLTGKTVLLRPEQGFELQGSAAEVLGLCDADRSMLDIVDHLAAVHPASPRAEIAADVERLLAALARRRLVELGLP